VTGDPRWISDDVWGARWYDGGEDPLDLRGTLGYQEWEEAEMVTELFLFAGIFNIPRLCQDAIDRPLWCYNKAYATEMKGSFGSTATIRKAYKNTIPGSGLRNLLVDGWLTFQESLTRTVLDELPEDFLVDIWMQKERNGHKKNGCEISFGCDYHEHFSEEEKKDCVVRVEVLI
jgi:hypothetical protein